DRNVTGVQTCALPIYTKGPVPTGSSLVVSTGSSMSSQMCSGTMTVFPMACSYANWGSSNVTSTVRSSVASASVIGKAAALVAGCSSIMLKVNATSSAVKSSPSDHSTPSRSSNVATVPSSLNSKDSASHGTESSTCMGVLMISGS